MGDTAETTDVPLAGPVFGQADVPGMKNFPGASATAYLNLHLARQRYRKLIGDAGMPVHEAILPAKQPESRACVRSLSRIQHLGKQLGEFSEIGALVRAFDDTFELRRALQRPLDQRAGS